jgi:hypothetical protein
MENEQGVSEAYAVAWGGSAGEGMVSGPGRPCGCHYPAGCLLWNTARGKETGSTERKIKISVMDDFSQQLAVTY